MDFESPDVEKDFPGLYASEATGKSPENDFSDDGHDKPSKKDLLIGKRKDKKDKGYVAFEGESSGDEMDGEQMGLKRKTSKVPFKFPRKDKSKDKVKEGKEEEKKEKKKEEEKKEKKKEKEKEKSKHVLKKKKSKSVGEEAFQRDERPIFGVPLDIAIERNKCHDGIELPAIVRECIDYIEEHGLPCEGIYRLSGVKSKVQQLRAKYDKGDEVYLYEHEPHIVASLLKLFLRELPEPVLTDKLKDQFEEVSAKRDQNEVLEGLKNLINKLPNSNRLLLSWIFVHMEHIISLEKQNKMNVQNVSIVLSPTMQISHCVLNALFMHSRELFKNVTFKK
uniref:Rho-GAP domain-containing protein n=1 Tax=Strigamia maritima TaxID=126957 RepID=T1JMI2_STRMM